MTDKDVEDGVRCSCSCLGMLLVVGFWIGVAVIVLHFVFKYW